MTQFLRTQIRQSVSTALQQCSISRAVYDVLVYGDLFNYKFNIDNRL